MYRHNLYSEVTTNFELSAQESRHHRLPSNLRLRAHFEIWTRIQHENGIIYVAVPLLVV